ncbi:XK-related protein 8-like [Rhinichthys klamathensis goyatoka]|uniref:XK-related protein 8-like n=1 Tax=Rhinichthys klamathensis goyatoka TaxID=3034132 RepID=UPI0024B4C180|nr:XK-related protein 8-like [Rhinichthys klamathensis goyatoka]
MEESFPFKYSLLEYLFTLVGFFLFLLDIALDIWTVVLFYQEGAYVYMAVMIFLLLGSSVLLQVFSWVWYSDFLKTKLKTKVEEIKLETKVEETKLETKVEETKLETKVEETKFKLVTKVEKFANGHKLIKPLHFLQLGVYLRYAGVIEISTILFRNKTNRFTEGVAVLLNQDLQMLRLFEAFSESAPQLILMMCRNLQRGELELITGLKILSSAAAIAFTVALYHRSMRSFLQEKRKMSWIPTGVYFLWNLLLIIPRVTALALFCSVLPCYIIAHFLSLWMLLVLGVWSQKTDHMESPGWECLFRACVGLIWYFSWFNVSTGSMKIKTVLYNGVMGLDTMMLLGFWCWKVFEYTGCWSSLNPYIVIPTLLGLYLVGILVKIIYYTWFHPNCDEQKIVKPSKHQKNRHNIRYYRMNMESENRAPVQPKDGALAQPEPVTGVLKRGMNMAANFYY